MEKNKTKGIFSLILAMLLLLPACSETTVENDDKASTDVQTPGAEEVVVEEDEPDIYANVPTGDYGGSDFNLLQYEETSAATATICVEELTGESFNDAVYQRTLNVEENLNVKIGFLATSLSDVTSTITSSVTAGDDFYQAVWQHSTTAVVNFVANGYAMKLNGISAFDFSAPWWNQNAMNSIRLTEDDYMAFGDINYYLFDFQSIIICNSPFITDNNMEDPYTLVDEGEWTIDKFLGMVESAANDLDGDGVLGGAKDMIGFTGYTTATELGFTHSADVELFSRDENGNVKYDGVSEKYFDVVQRYSNVIGRKELAEHNGDYLGRFRNGLTLFTSCSVGDLSKMREVEFDFKVLPFPKYDSAQENYISFVTNQIQPMIIPITVQDTERAGVVLENMCAESHKVVREKYFDELVNYKYVRDQESVKNLRMMYSNDTRFEVGHIYNWGGVESIIVAALTGQGDTFVSKMEKNEKVMSKMMEKTMNAIMG